MFAFVIWDRLQSSAFGARDRLGIKPLCWAIKGGDLIVSTTIEPFEALDGFNQIDPVAVRDLLTFDYIPSPHTIRQGVKKLEPGCRFSWRLADDELSVERYWNPPLPDQRLAPPHPEELEALLTHGMAFALSILWCEESQPRHLLLAICPGWLRSGLCIW